MNINEYMDYLESEMYDEYDDMYESYEDKYDDAYESELESYDEYDKIQVLRETVEDQFINDELDYEEYEMLIDRLDEREMYLEAKVDDMLADKLNHYKLPQDRPPTPQEQKKYNDFMDTMKRRIRRKRKVGASTYAGE